MRCALRARPRTVAVRSLPPRPSVTRAPSGLAPTKPGTTGMTRRRSSGARRSRTRRSVAARSGKALPKTPSVTMSSAASTYWALARRACIPATTSRADSCSPRATRKSRVRGVSSRRLATPCARVRSSANASSSSFTSEARARRVGMMPSATATCRASRRSTAASAARKSPVRADSAMASRASVTPASADTTVTTGEGRGVRIRSMACRTAAASASDAPPNLNTSTAFLRPEEATRDEREGGAGRAGMDSEKTGCPVSRVRSDTSRGRCACPHPAHGAYYSRVRVLD